MSKRGGGTLYHPKYRDAAGVMHESPTWWARYRQNGRDMRESTGTTSLEKARTFLHKRLGAVARGERIDPKADRVTFATMAEALRRDYRMNNKHLITLEARLKHLEPAFGGRRMARLLMADVERYKDARLVAGASNGSVNRELEVLAHAFTLGRKQGLLTTTLPVRDARLTEAAPKAGFFSREEYEAIRREIAIGARTRDARPDLVLAITLYHEFGWRVQEVLGLETRHVNLNEGDHGTLRLDAGTTKGATMTGNSDGRVVFLTAEVRRLVEEQLYRVGKLERQLGRVVPYLFPHLKG
jgi:integrase